MQLASDSPPAAATDAGAPGRAEVAGAPESPAAGNQSGLVRNTFYLTAAQAATIPISVLSNALIGRFLGPSEFGYMYLATTLCTFGVLGVEWGLHGSVPALVARNRSQAGTYLGTSLVWRAVSSTIIAGVLALACLALGYEKGVLWAVALAYPLAVINSVCAGYKDTIRGFERTDIPAFVHVAQQFLTAIVMVPVLMLGGDLRMLLLSQVAVAVLTALYLHRSLSAVGVTTLSFDKQALKPLFKLGTPFVVFGLALVLAPNINATFLSKLAPANVIGWFGVSQRLIGLLIFPASALVGALYPTLCRLATEDNAEFVRVSRSSLYGVTLLAVPAAVGCGMFPEIGVSIFGTAEFSGAADHLRLMSLFVFLVYFSMPLGTAIMAGTRQKEWTVVQCICLVVSLVGSPFLVPYFQRRMGNGAVGTCLTLVISELLVVAFAMGLAPKGLFDAGLRKSIALALLAGAAMGGVAYITKPISLFLAVPLAVLTYAGVAWLIGAIAPRTIDMLKGILGRKLARFRA
jgi:O-antigen/teichoic acid export membrane protein